MLCLGLYIRPSSAEAVIACDILTVRSENFRSLLD